MWELTFEYKFFGTLNAIFIEVIVLSAEINIGLGGPKFLIKYYFIFLIIILE